MDFVLESSESEFNANSPQVLRTRLPVRSDRGKALPTLNKSKESLSSRSVVSTTREELQAVYDRLDTPKASERSISAKTLFDATKERMKLANIIDSETQGDDTDNFFLRPITMQAPLSAEKVPKFRGKTDSDADSFDLQLEDNNNDDDDDFSDKDDLLAEFTRPRDFNPNASIHVPQLTRNHHIHNNAINNNRSNDTNTNKHHHDYRNNQEHSIDDSDQSLKIVGKLLQIDSNSEHGGNTPRVRTIRDELDQSKTRFRQSINELLSSSPISASKTALKRDEFADLVKRGSKLSEELLAEVKESELKMMIQAKKLNSETSITTPQPTPRRITAEELRSLPLDKLAAFKETMLKNTEKDAVKHEIETDDQRSSNYATVNKIREENSIWSRLGWALGMLLFFIVVDLVIQAIVLRQEAGLVLFDWDYFNENLRELLGERIFEKFDSLRMTAH